MIRNLRCDVIQYRAIEISAYLVSCDSDQFDKIFVINIWRKCYPAVYDNCLGYSVDASCTRAQAIRTPWSCSSIAWDPSKGHSDLQPWRNMSQYIACSIHVYHARKWTTRAWQRDLNWLVFKVISNITGLIIFALGCHFSNCQFNCRNCKVCEIVVTWIQDMLEA